MKSKKLRVIIPVIILIAVSAGYFFHAGIGTLSAIGWRDISILCPVGGLSAMLAAKTFIPKALISLVLAVIGVLLLGKAFCGWICPVPVVEKLRSAFGLDDRKRRAAEKGEGAEGAGTVNAAPLTEKELSRLKGCAHGCAAKREKVDSRHWILGGSLLSAAIFGFPVFCLICPIGLTFATILLVFLLFSGGDVTWSVVLVPVLLLLEVVFFRKWCSKICPVSAFMSLIAKGNRTFVPTVDPEKCLESKDGVHCGACTHVCAQGIDIAHPERGVATNECMKCRACVDACPTQAITMPFLPKKGAKTSQDVAAE